jgi:hypothetical protein
MVYLISDLLVGDGGCDVIKVPDWTGQSSVDTQLPLCA